MSQMLPINSNSAVAKWTPDNSVEAQLKHRIFINGFMGVRSVNVTSNNRFLIITYEQSPEIRIVDMAKLTFLQVTYPGHTDSIRMTSITSDNRSFVTASWDGTWKLFDLLSGKLRKNLVGFGRSPCCYIAGNLLFTGAYESDVDPRSGNTGRCWDLDSGNAVHRYPHSNFSINTECIDIISDGVFVYTGSDDGKAQKWKINGEPELKYFECQASIRKIAISDSFFAAACTDGFVRLSNKHTGERLKTLKHKASDIREVRISQDEKKLFSADEYGNIYCYSLPSGRLVYSRKFHTGPIWSICLMNEDQVLVAGSCDSTVSFVSVETGKLLARLFNNSAKDFLITCPPDSTVAKNGFFCTSNTGLIEVFSKEAGDGASDALSLDDPRRVNYLKKWNLRNLVLIRLKNNGGFTSVSNNYSQRQEMIRRLKQKPPNLLDSN